MKRIVLLIAILVFITSVVYCQDQPSFDNKTVTSKFIANDYVQIKKNPLNKLELLSREYHFDIDTVKKFSQELRDYETIGLLGNRQTINFLKDFLHENENNNSYVYQSVCKYYIYCSLVMLGERQYIDDLIKGLSKAIPEYAEWLREGVVNANDNWMSSEVLRRLSEYGILFDASHIDQMIKALNHPDDTIVYNIDYILNQSFGILFSGQEPNWIHKSQEIRLPHIQAWEKFWEQNRNRYGLGLPWIINDLELQIQHKKEPNGSYLVINIINHGDVAWDIFVEATGEFDDMNPAHCGKWLRSFFVLAGKDRIYPTMPLKYFQPASVSAKYDLRALGISDRLVHIEKITLLSGSSYTYIMDLGQAFPNNEFQTGDKLCLQYAANPYWHDGLDVELFDEAKVWKGELRSGIVTLK